MSPDSIKPSVSDWRLDRPANQIRFRSRANRPLGDLSALQRGLLLAEASLAVTLRDSEIGVAAEMVGLALRAKFSGGLTQACCLDSPTDTLVVVCGGSRMALQQLLLHDSAMTAAETVGRVHSGMKAEADRVWGALELYLESNQKALWIAGHSLGAAVAQILAARCLLSYIRSEPSELHTFGGPRVGDRNYVEYPRLRHYRWERAGDMITELPFVTSGFRHAGLELKLNEHGLAARPGIWRQSLSPLRELMALRSHRSPDFSQNSIGLYVESLFEAVRNEEQADKPLV